ncbi:MAG: hypothetical protein FWG87_10535 [Defluviitaleaceae bacterium]|nr:hypothetical protein [Defluviitaleaceae bacterium]
MKDEIEAKAITEEQLGEVSGGGRSTVESCNFVHASSFSDGTLTKTVGEGADAVTWAKCHAFSCTDCTCKGVACIDNWHKQYGCSRY